MDVDNLSTLQREQYLASDAFGNSVASEAVTLRAVIKRVFKEADTPGRARRLAALENRLADVQRRLEVHAAAHAQLIDRLTTARSDP